MRHGNKPEILRSLVDIYTPIYRASYTRRRDFVTSVENLEAGKYAIVPSTYQAEVDGKFFMRIFVEKPYHESEEHDDLYA